MSDVVTYLVLDAKDERGEAVAAAEEYRAAGRNVGVEETWRWNMCHPDVSARTACTFVVFEQVRPA